MMKKSLFICAGLCLLLALTGTALVYPAQDGNEPYPPFPNDNTCDNARKLGIVKEDDELIIDDRIGINGDQDWFRVCVPVGHNWRLIVYTTGRTNTYGYLYNDTCTNMLAMNNNSSSPKEGTNFRIEKYLSYGCYRIGVKGYYSAYGPYTLHVTSINPADEDLNSCNNAATMGVVQSGSHLTRDADIDIPNDADFFRVRVQPNTDLYVYTTGSTDTYGTLYQLRCGECAYVKSNDDGPGFPYPWWESWKLPNFWLLKSNYGNNFTDYVIKVKGYGTITGHYSIIVRGTQCYT